MSTCWHDISIYEMQDDADWKSVGIKQVLIWFFEKLAWFLIFNVILIEIDTLSLVLLPQKTHFDSRKVWRGGWGEGESERIKVLNRERFQLFWLNCNPREWVETMIFKLWLDESFNYLIIYCCVCLFPCFSLGEIMWPLEKTCYENKCCKEKETKDGSSISLWPPSHHKPHPPLLSGSFPANVFEKMVNASA